MRVSSTNTIKVTPITPSSKVKKDKPRMEEVNPNHPRPVGIQRVELALKKARPWGLEAEVVWSALMLTAKTNTHFDGREEQTMEQVLDAACNEWDI